MGFVFEMQVTKSKLLSQKKVYPAKSWQLCTLTDFRVQGETCLAACRAKLIREFYSVKVPVIHRCCSSNLKQIYFAWEICKCS